MSKTPIARVYSRLLAVTATFALGVATGLALLGVRYLLHGSPDPFNDGLPLFLQIASFGCGLTFTLTTRRPVTAILGLYCGLVGYMLIAQTSEYPSASAIALAVHSLLPASVGALLGLVLLAQRHKNR